MISHKPCRSEQWRKRTAPPGKQNAGESPRIRAQPKPATAETAMIRQEFEAISAHPRGDFAKPRETAANGKPCHGEKFSR